MPIYEFSCDHCGAEFEELLALEGRAPCPKCGTRQVTKRFSVPARAVAATKPPSACESGMPQDRCCGGGACQYQ